MTVISPPISKCRDHNTIVVHHPGIKQSHHVTSARDQHGADRDSGDSVGTTFILMNGVHSLKALMSTAMCVYEDINSDSVLDVSERELSRVYANIFGVTHGPIRDEVGHFKHARKRQGKDETQSLGGYLANSLNKNAVV